VKSGATLCTHVLNFTNGGLVGYTAFVQGYLAPDK
jgi:hypothetical protein